MTFAEYCLIEFKGARRDFFKNPDQISLRPNEHVIVQAERGEDLGQFTKRVLWARSPAQSTSAGELGTYSILRKATFEEIERWYQNREKEKASLRECKHLVVEYGLEMKLVDVEYQFDSSKITFYFTADHRVDFRALVKELAAIYKTRIELRQIGVRDEARRLGGFGRCGLRQCCTTFIREFPTLQTQLAREQNLPISPSRITGNCGRLLCCLAFEKDTYAASAEIFPKPGSRFETVAGAGEITKVDIFRQEMTVKLDIGGETKLTAIDLQRLQRNQAGVFTIWRGQG